MWPPWVLVALLAGAAYSVLSPFEAVGFASRGVAGYAAVLVALAMSLCSLLLIKHNANTRHRAAFLAAGVFLLASIYSVGIGQSLLFLALASASIGYQLSGKKAAFVQYAAFNGSAFVIAGLGLALPAYHSPLLTLAIAMLLGIFPFHSWLMKSLESGGAAAAAIAGPLLGTVLVLAIKAMPLLDAGALVVLGGAAAIVGIILSLADRKNSLPAAVMAETGLVLTMLGAGVAVLLVLFADIFAKAVLFTAADEGDDLGMAVGALSLGGLPVSASFFGKMLESEPRLAALSEVAGLLLMAACLRHLPGGKQRFNAASFSLAMCVVGLAALAFYWLWAKGVAL